MCVRRKWEVEQQEIQLLNPKLNNLTQTYKLSQQLTYPSDEIVSLQNVEGHKQRKKKEKKEKNEKEKNEKEKHARKACITII